MSKLYPIKVLLDANKKPFIPFITSTSIVVDGTEYTVQDMFDMRYTKEEVDAIIQSLGTLQRLRGRVDTYEDLLRIEGQQAGDTYIVGTSDTENSEYMWIGEKWEKLGPLVDLTDYYNKADIDALLASADANIAGAIAQGDNETLNLAKNYAEDKVAEAMSNISLDGALVYKGHVNAEAELPNLGQPTGGYITPALSLGTNSTDWILVPATGTSVLYTQIRDLGYSYFATIESRDYKSYRTGVGVLTDYPEQVSIQFEHRGNFTSYSPIYGMVFHIKYDPNKPVYYTYNKLSSGPTPTIKTATTETAFSTTITTPATPTLVTEDMIIGVKGANSYGSNYGGVYDSSDGLCAAIRITTNFPALHYTASDIYFSTPYKTLTTANGYNYNTGMILLSNNTGNVSDTKYQTNTTEASENDVYTVGSSYEIYRCNNKPAWEHWSQGDGYSKEEIDAMFGEAEAALDEIIEGV